MTQGICLKSNQLNDKSGNLFFKNPAMINMKSSTEFLYKGLQLVTIYIGEY